MTRRTLLLVSASAESTVSLHDHFRESGYDLRFAQSADEALSIARRDLPEAIVLDSEVPGLDVAAVSRELRASPRTRHIHLTLLAPQSERDARLAALAAGVDEFMIKPIDVEELELRIRNALRRAAYQNLVNPISGLPGPYLVEDRLRELLAARSNWALMRLSLRGFKPFTDVYGFLAGEEVLRFAGRLFGEVMNEFSSSNDFLGHTGDDNFVMITAPEMLADLRHKLRQRFDEGIKSHYSFREREQGFVVLRGSDGSETRVPLMTLVVRTTTSEDGPFTDIRELAAF
ncbi:MAG TPA: response regulator [Anaerolineae bacterium]|nr:response regulator [Anaerolineae bacterium]